MTNDEWNDAVMLRLQDRFEVITDENSGDFLVKLSPIGKPSASAAATPIYVGSGETLMEALVIAVLQVLQSDDRKLLPYPQGISSAMRAKTCA